MLIECWTTVYDAGPPLWGVATDIETYLLLKTQFTIDDTSAYQNTQNPDISVLTVTVLTLLLLCPYIYDLTRWNIYVKTMKTKGFFHQNRLS